MRSPTMDQTACLDGRAEVNYDLPRDVEDSLANSVMQAHSEIRAALAEWNARRDAISKSLKELKELVEPRLCLAMAKLREGMDKYDHWVMACQEAKDLTTEEVRSEHD